MVNTILSDDDAYAIGQTHYLPSNKVRAIEAAVLAKLRDQEPVAFALRFTDDARLCLSTVFDTEKEARDYAESLSSKTVIVPLNTTPLPAVAQVPQPGQGKELHDKLMWAIQTLIRARDEPSKWGSVGPDAEDLAWDKVRELVNYICVGIDSPPTMPAAAPESPVQADKRCCGNDECGWSGFTDRMIGGVGPVCPQCGETTERDPEAPAQAVSEREALSWEDFDDSLTADALRAVGVKQPTLAQVTSHQKAMFAALTQQPAAQEKQ